MMTQTIARPKLVAFSVKLKNFLFAILFLLLAVFKDGNLNLLFFFSALLIVWNLIAKKESFAQAFLNFVPFLLAELLALAFSPLFNDLSKSLVYLAKIFLCINLLVSAKNKHLFNEFDFELFSKMFSVLLFVLTIFAVATQSSMMWRFDDAINLFSSKRLQLFYTEPSELSEMCAGFFLFRLYYFLKHKTMANFWVMTLILIPLILSAGMTGIAYLGVSLAWWLLLSVLRDIAIGNLRGKRLALVLTLVLAFVLVFATNNPIGNRAIYILAGKDGSFNFRFTKAADLLPTILDSTNCLGTGFGQMNTQAVLSTFSMLKFANSFMYFIAEGGIIAALIIVFRFAYVLHSIRKGTTPGTNVRYLLLSVLLFLTLIEITGGYFTNPYYWFLYGILCSGIFASKPCHSFAKALNRRLPIHE